jgi:signal transduction histidine kinase
MNILVVEDNPGDARLVTELLQELADLSAAVTVVTRLSEVRSVIESPEPPDAILLDLALPDAVGCEAVSKVVPMAPGVPVVVLTGSGNEELGTEAVREGAQDYLLKSSLSATILGRAIRYAIERQRSQNTERLLAEIASAVALSMDYDVALQRLVQLSARALGDVCLIDVYSEDGSSRRIRATPEGGEAQGSAYLPEESSSGDQRPVVASIQKQSHRLVEVAREDLVLMAHNQFELEELEALQLRSIITIPLLDKETLLGSMVFGSKVRTFNDDDQALAEKIGRIAAPELANARLYRKAQEAIRARDRVLGIVAHDLRNPLSAISMSAELLMEPNFTSEQRLRQIQVIRRSTDRMSRLIQDLLDVARIESDQLQLHLAVESAEKLAREAIELNTSLAASRGLSLSAKCPETHPTPINADRDRVIQVLSNLVGNAIKFTPEHGSVTLSVTQGDNETLFSVADTGPGISPEDQAHLFTPFWQARRFSTDGAGLGLSIAKGIVEAHHGRIGVESRIGEGTTVWFTIPNVPERRARKDLRELKSA